MSKYTVYLRRNKVNGKCYVGQTSDFKSRQRQWRCLTTTYTNKHIDEDRAKYGLDNWTVEILGEIDNQEEAWELEQRFIRDYNTLWPNGYNLAKGGGGPNGVHHSDKTRQKMSEAKKGEKNYWYGKHLYDETRQKMSEAKKGKQLNREDTSKKVYQYTLDGQLVKIWPSVRECERHGFIYSSIIKCCYGVYKTSNGYRWSHQPL